MSELRLFQNGATGKQNQEIAVALASSIPRISKWRRWFAEKGLAGLEDEPRPGKPETNGKAFRDRLLVKLEDRPPEGLARWDCPALADALNASQYAVWRALKKKVFICIAYGVGVSVTILNSPKNRRILLGCT